MINIGVLVENSAISNWHGREHGLSLHIKTNNYNMLFDFGQSRIFIHNAGLMGIDLADVDIAFYLTAIMIMAEESSTLSN